MAREIVVLCDRHADQDEPERRPALTVTVALDGEPPKEVDLCSECRTALIDPLQRLLDEHGAAPQGVRQPPAKPQRRSVAKLTAAGNGELDRCLWCSETYVAGTGALTSHLRREHGFNSQGDAFGNACPLCGLTYGYLGAHARQHQQASVPALFTHAQAEGDPHGVVAQVIAAGQPRGLSPVSA